MKAFLTLTSNKFTQTIIESAEVISVTSSLAASINFTPLVMKLP